jgi:hypothetical protein
LAVLHQYAPNVLPSNAFPNSFKLFSGKNVLFFSADADQSRLAWHKGGELGRITNELASFSFSLCWIGAVLL